MSLEKKVLALEREKNGYIFYLYILISEVFYNKITSIKNLLTKQKQQQQKRKVEILKKDK